MKRMLNYDTQIIHQFRVIYDEEHEHANNSDDNLHNDPSSNNENDHNEIMLPTFVKESLDNMKKYDGTINFMKSMNHFLLLVPMESKRKIYLRLYKWVVSFATWNYSTVSNSISQLTLQNSNTMKNNENENNNNNNNNNNNELNNNFDKMKLESSNETKTNNNESKFIQIF